MKSLRRLLVISLLLGLGGCANFAIVDPQVAGFVVCKPGSAISYRMEESERGAFPKYMYGTGGTCR